MHSIRTVHTYLELSNVVQLKVNVADARLEQGFIKIETTNLRCSVGQQRLVEDSHKDVSNSTQQTFGYNFE